MERQPRYLLHEPMGAGGMGVVFRGTLVSPAGERPVAIKQVAERGRIDPRRRARLIAEARLVFRLTHANICQVLDLGEGERGTFVVMELVRGCDLRALLERLAARGRTLAPASALYVAREVARGLDYAHRCRGDDGAPLGLVHGDVTPQNVLLSVEGEVKLADFGIADALGDAPGTGLRAGTPGYLAPELDHGARDHRVDIYALGVTLLVTLTNLPPAEALRLLPELARRRPDLSPDLAAILARATAAAPEERFLSAGELERALSIELARRHPTFTPSVLAEVVRACAPERPAERAHDTLVSMTEVEPLAPDADSRPAPRTAHTATATATATTDGARGGGRRALAMGALLLAAAVGAGVALLRPGSRAAAPHAAPTAATRPVAAPPAPPAPGPVELPTPKQPEPAAAPASTRPAPEPPIAAAPSHAPASHGPTSHAPASHGLASRTPPPHAPGARAPRHRAPAAAEPGALLTVNATPWAAVLVDGHRVADETPLYRFPVPPGDHVVTVRFADGAEAPPRRLHLAPGELRTLGFTR